MSRELIYLGLINDLKSLLDETMSCSDFRRKYLVRDSFDWRSLPNIAGNLDHFISDYDLRARDPNYKKMQIHELNKLIRLLEAHAADDELLKIHFLGYS